MDKLRIYNAFGIKPTSNHVAAGIDFYIPNIAPIGQLPTEKYLEIIDAFCDSYGVTKEEIENILNGLIFYASATVENEEYVNKNELNILHLFLALGKSAYDKSEGDSLNDAIEFFVDSFLVFDKDGKAGIRAYINDHVKINSGIKIKLDPGYAGEFKNKSGRGSKGWDIRACLVDEDYAGFVHLSLSFTSSFVEDSCIYCGDKLTQMVIYKVEHTDIVEVDAAEYEELQSESERGSAGFGSSNEQH